MQCETCELTGAAGLACAQVCDEQDRLARQTARAATKRVRVVRLAHPTAHDD